jgi:Flp pilus assembly secretin CpaC
MTAPAQSGTISKDADPQTILKEARKALAAGQFDRALDLSHAAETYNRSGRWGLFDDTPNSVQHDVQTARAKTQKLQSEKLTKDAKALLAKPAASEDERLAYLDQALQLAQRANQLHGPYSAWDMGDRPDKLVMEIQAARSHLRPAAPSATAPAANNPYASTFQPSANSPAGAMAAKAPVNDAKKASAIQLMGEAKKLADQGLYGQAKAKLMEADRIGATFSATEYSPSLAVLELNRRGSNAIDQLVAEAKANINKKDYARADAALNGANDVATALGLYARPIDDTRNLLRRDSSGKFGGSGASSLVATSGTEVMAPVVSPTSATPVVGSVPAANAKPGLTAGGSLSAKQLLDQADIEFRHGDLELATRLAERAHNLGAQDEARRLLNSIDAERLNIKTISAGRSLDNAQSAFKSKDYSHALSVLVLIDPLLLTPEQQTKWKELRASCQAELRKNSETATVAVAGGTQTAEPPVVPTPPSEVPISPGLINPPGTARVGNDPKASADNLGNQVEALRRVQFQKLRSEGLKVQSDALEAYGRGECDLAIQLLLDYTGRVRAANLEPSSVAMLLRPIDSRLEMFRVMKGNQEALGRLKQENREARELVRANSGAAEEQRKDEVKKIFEKYRALVKAQKFDEAEKVAMQAKQLDPDNPAVTALYETAKLQKAVKAAEQLKDEKEKMFREGLNDAEHEGPLLTVDDPVRLQLERNSIARRRGSGDLAYVRTHTQGSYEIEVKLNKPILIDFSQTPLEQAVENLKTLTGIPLVIDYTSLEAEGISPVKPITVKPGIQVATKNLLAFTLEQAGLSYVIEHDLVKITTTKKAKGRLFTKVFSVADLVTPVPNFTLPDYANFEKMMVAATGNYGQRNTQPIAGTAQLNQSGGLPGGVLAGTQATTPGIGTGVGFQGGTLQSNLGDGKPNPLGSSVNLAGDRNTKHEQLIKLITGMVRPYTWDGMGGPGRLEYYDIGSALVVNQTADVIQEVADLLEALRRLQDLAIAVELRIVSLSESWYERMGVDFSVNILTNSTKLQPSLTTVDPNTGAAGVFAPSPYINSIGNVHQTVGLTPAGTFTPDLNVPVTNSSFAQAIPPFGGYPNTPGSDGGVSLGLAFLNEIQVYLFMEAAAGDRRVNVMQAPKLTLFNGQTASISVANTQFAVTNVTVTSVNGQIVFSPTNTPLPGPGDFNPTNPLQSTQGPGVLSVTIQGVVSADRRFVRLNLPVTMASQTGATVPLFPITTFVTPVFEGGSQGQPIPFTQFLQQPAFTTLQINTTVVCPDGGTVLLGGFKQLSEGRNEFGPPFLSDIPYLNRLFKNVGIGRETTHIMIMVTPRIIINSEEEIFQTEGRPSP